MKYFNLVAKTLFFLFCNYLVLSQPYYCISITPTENITSVTYTGTFRVSVPADASLQWVGTGDLAGRTAIIGGSGSGPFVINFTRTKTGNSGTFNFTINATPPDYGVKAQASPFLNLEDNCAAFGPLPITLHTFSATQHSEMASKLDWTTSSEINSAYFGIERSRDGDTWDAIGKVSAAGNSHTELAYEYIDDNLPFSRTADQIYYYRLRLTDQDGSHKYSDIKAVNFSRKPSDGIAIYPNPAIQMVHLDISTMDAAAGEIDLRIYDIHGRIMADKQIIGAGIEPIDVTQYPTGTYNISVTQGNTQHQKRFIKIE